MNLILKGPPEVGQERLVVGQGGGIERDALHNLVLQVRLAFGNPSRNTEKARRALPQQQEEGLMKRIQLDECPVKIHAQWDGNFIVQIAETVEVVKTVQIVETVKPFAG